MDHMERSQSIDLERKPSAARTREPAEALVSASGRKLPTRTSPSEFESASGSFKKRRPGQHKITIGKSDKSTVDLLEDVPRNAQLFLEYKDIKAWVPAMAPGGSSILPGIPKITLPTFGRAGKQDEPPSESDKMRQVGLFVPL